MCIKSFKDLIVWRKSIELCKEIYKLVKLLPKEETYCLSDQMRRAVVSISSNIAEGQSRSSKNEFLQFISIASGSNSELYTQLIICKEIGYLNDQQIKDSLLLIEEISKMLSSLKNKLNSYE